MIRQILIIGFALLSSISLFAQFILAGTHGGQDYYIDQIPDRPIHVTWSYYSNAKDSFLIDINGDSINDFTVIALTDGGGKWYSTLYTAIRPLNNNHIAISTYDSCFANCPPDSFLYRTPMADPFSNNDTINQNNSWVDSLTYFSFSKSSASYPNGCGYSCGGYSFPYPISKYIGLSVLVSGGTIYGWIKINSVKSDSLVIEEYACNLIPTSIESYNNNLSINLYPNPASSQLHVELNGILKKMGTYKIYDTLGHIVESQKAENIQQLKTIAVEYLPNGLYFLSIESENFPITRRKFTINR